MTLPILHPPASVEPRLNGDPDRFACAVGLLAALDTFLEGPGSHPLRVVGGILPTRAGLVLLDMSGV
jgi:hypothetical protein